MAGGSYRGPLPDHLAIGRGDSPGPQLGGLIALSGHVKTFTSTSEIAAVGWLAPVNMRLQAACVYVRSVSAGTFTVRLLRGTTFDPVTATQISTVSYTGSSAKLIGPSLEDSVGVSILAAGQRDIAQGEALFFGMNLSGVATTLDVSVHVFAVAQGYSQVNLMTGDAAPSVNAFAD